MPNWHDDNCGCARCAAEEDRFWLEQEGGGRGFSTPHDAYEFDVSDLDDAADLDDVKTTPVVRVEASRLLEEDDITW